ncbi:MAG: serine/threonine protein kinase [Planctomycetes bacterium]|nr:serine/threonine protein kinase [Planctomycetota bacterium]
MALPAGSRLYDRYTVLAARAGGMGVVYIVREDGTGRRFAVKAIREDLLATPHVVERFRDASRNWIDLGRHDHIVQALCFDEQGPVPLLFLEHVEGFELKDLLDLGHPVFLPQALRWATEIASAMEYAHGREFRPGVRGIVHRDLKPGNILVARDGGVKVSDFGLARLQGRPLHATVHGSFLGTAYYISPEQIRDPAAVDGRADIFSFGIVLYEMLAGHRPFEAESFATLIYRILNEPPRRPPAGTWPPALHALLEACLAKVRDARPPSFSAILEALAPIARAAGDPSPGPAYRVCPACGLVVPADLDGCLFDRTRAGTGGLDLLPSQSDTVDWGAFAQEEGRTPPADADEPRP